MILMDWVTDSFAISGLVVLKAPTKEFEVKNKSEH